MSSHGPYQEKVSQSKKTKSRKSNYHSEIKSQISIKSKKSRSGSIESLKKLGPLDDYGSGYNSKEGDLNDIKHQRSQEVAAND